MRLLIKIGSALISKNGKLNYEWLDKKISEIAKFHSSGNEIIIISSGSVAAGMEIANIKERPSEILKLQLLSGMGQIKLITHYKKSFEKRGIHIAQVLLTHHNFSTKKEKETITNIMNAYLKDGNIPIVNENDLINKEELEYKRSFTDNDVLAALVAVNLNIDMALILTDVDGLYSGDPKLNRTLPLVEEIEHIDNRIMEMASKSKSSLGIGGMKSKIVAASIINDTGADVIVGNGVFSISDLLAGKVKRTMFRGGAKISRLSTMI